MNLARSRPTPTGRANMQKGSVMTGGVVRSPPPRNLANGPGRMLDAESDERFPYRRMPAQRPQRLYARSLPRLRFLSPLSGRRPGRGGEVEGERFSSDA